MRKTIEDLLAEAEIKDLQMRYCRGVDRMDFELLRACFHPDATAEYHAATDVDGFIEMGRQTLPRYVTTTHNTGNQLVEVNGDTAWAEHYAVATLRLAADEQHPERDFVAGVRYVDRLECRDGDWRIARRVLIRDWARVDPVGDRVPERRGQAGKRDRGDASYSVR